MTKPGCRIGRVRMKETGGEIYILPDMRPGRDDEAREWFASAMSALEEFSEDEDIVGVALVAVTGTYEVFTAFEAEEGDLYRLGGAVSLLGSRINMKVLGPQAVAEALDIIDA